MALIPADQLVRILQDPVEQAIFKNFCENNLNGDNVDFLIAVRNALQEERLNKTINLASCKQIFDKFIAFDSPTQASVDFEVVSDLAPLYHSGALSATSFDAAYEEVFNQICSQSLPDYLQHKLDNPSNTSSAVSARERNDGGSPIKKSPSKSFSSSISRPFSSSKSSEIKRARSKRKSNEKKRSKQDEFSVAAIFYVLHFLWQEPHIREIGLFRIGGSKGDVNNLLKDLREASADDSLNSVDLANVDVSVVATVLKLLLKELEEPIVPFAMYDHCVAFKGVDSTNSQACQKYVRKLLSRMCKESCKNLAVLIHFLSDLCDNSHMNKMSPSSTAKIFSPLLIHPRSVTVSQMMDDGPALNALLEELISRVEAYFPESSLSTVLPERRATTGTHESKKLPSKSENSSSSDVSGIVANSASTQCINSLVSPRLIKRMPANPSSDNVCALGAARNTRMSAFVSPREGRMTAYVSAPDKRQPLKARLHNMSMPPLPQPPPAP